MPSSLFNPAITTASSHSRPSPDRLRTGLRNLVIGMHRRIAFSWHVRTERRHLMRLSPEALRDIGIDRRTADTEGKRSLFDLPANRSD